jgi:hypothetical protein
MASPKYKEFYDLMLKQNKQDFDNFAKIHASYVKDPKKWQEKFNEFGRDIQDIIRDYENRLCRQSEGAGNSKFTTALAAKFHAEVKAHFPKIDFIGME